ncbi:hypothetical protein B1748_06140 [Paenibacillus sp. MY03]|uniref:hypothetical protein n=1 Tax=Paenibacillus sp. MY03 TaxID=302980 RepID=UPI000B3D4352|nr:hypothetical protein [Paenibacillus sp. MY03]OUS77380.1 hypothetical protein B1748_06140 [Paenibacillus sp. MY03]
MSYGSKEEHLTMDTATKAAQAMRGKLWIRAAFVCLATVLVALSLSGCMYPKERLKGKVAPKEAIRNVQGAIDQYYDDLQLLPIKNSSQSVPVYEKYLIDFGKLQAKGYISDVPAASFEGGGHYYFLILDEETEPRVKLMDIVTSQRINDIQNWVNAYIKENTAVPKGDSIYPGFYEIDYGKLKQKEPIITSVYSGTTQRAIVDEDGTVFTDYGIDIMQLLERNGEASYEENIDLRTLLVDSSDYVPVKSPAYKLVEGEPVAIQP